MSSNLTLEENRRRTKRIWRDVWIWLCLTLVILVVKWGFEHTDLGEEFKIATHRFLQRELISSRGLESVPIAVVDISDLAVEDIVIDGETYRATPRDKLLKLIEALASHEPLAIAVDIDFSPNEKGNITPADPKFFQDCINISAKNKIPIILGIKRSEIYPPEYWLGHKDYKDLAASIFSPQKDTRKLWAWIKPDKNSPKIRTMAAALAASLPETEQSVPAGLRWAVHQFTERDLGGGYFVSEYIVDYSPLDFIEITRIRTIKPEGIDAQSQLIQNKLVLIGNATLGAAMDTFPVPVRLEPVPGVYLHACGAYTLGVSALYEPTNKGRWALDILLSLLILAAITVIRLYFKSRTSSDVDAHWLQGFFTIVVIILAWIVGFLFVRSTRVLWDDFPLVTAGLLLHPRVERWLGNTWAFIKTDVAPTLARRVFKSEKEKDSE